MRKPFFLFLLVALVASCNKKNQDNPEQIQNLSQKQEIKGVAVNMPGEGNTVNKPETIILQKQDITGLISLPGELKPYEFVDLFARTSGFVKQVFVDRGSEVRKGDLLARLEAPEILAKLAESMARVHSAESRAERVKTGHLASKDSYERILVTSKTAGAISANELLRYKIVMDQDSLEYSSALKELEAAKSAHNAAKQLANYLEIVAPFNGIVTERNVHTGALVSPSNNTPLFRMEANKRLRLELALPESYSGMSNIGDTVYFTVSSLNNNKLKGIVSRQAKSISVRNRVEMIEADVDNDNHVLNSGSLAMAQIRFTKKDVLVVPESAILTTMQDRFVIKVSDKQPKRVSVSRGIQSGNLVEVYGDLTEGDEIYKVAVENLPN